MKKAAETKKPDNIEPGRMTTRTGVCKFCGQSRIITAYPEDDQEKLNELASQECECSSAQTEQKIAKSVFSMTRKIDKQYEGAPEEVRELLKAALRPVCSGAVKKATISCMDGNSYTVFCKERMLKILKSRTEQEEISEE